MKQPIISNRIQEYLKLQGKQQNWLTEQLNKRFNTNTTLPTVSSWCQNINQPSHGSLHYISKILDVSMNMLSVISSNNKIYSLRHSEHDITDVFLLKVGDQIRPLDEKRLYTITRIDGECPIAVRTIRVNDPSAFVLVKGK